MRKLLIVASILLVAVSFGIVNAQSPYGLPSVYLPLLVKPEATPTPTVPPPPTATPTQVPPPPSGVVVTSSNAFIPYEGSSSLYLVGEVTNYTNNNVQFVKIKGVLRNDAGQIVDGDYSYSRINTLAPGMISPFLIIFSNPPAWSRYELTVTWSTATRGPIQLETNNVEPYWDSSNAYHIRGAVRNQTGSQRTFVKVFVTMYDANNQVIGTDYTYTSPSTLEPGQEVPFDVDVYFWKGKPDRSQVVRFDVRAYDD